LWLRWGASEGKKEREPIQKKRKNERPFGVRGKIRGKSEKKKRTGGLLQLKTV